MWPKRRTFRGAELPQTGLAMRLPIGPGDAYATAVWMDLVLRLSGWKQTLLNTFWTPQQTALIHLGPRTWRRSRDHRADG